MSTDTSSTLHISSINHNNPITPHSKQIDSDKTLKVSPTDSLLSLSEAIVFLPSEISFQLVDLSWNFQTPTNLVDWIDECNPLFYLDNKTHGACGQKSGTLKWKITMNSMPPASQRAQLCFRYYSGLTGTIRASSPPLFVFTKAQVVITSIKCKNIKPSRNAYLVKLYNGNEVSHRTGLSSDGEWTDLYFNFPADLSQEVLLVVKEKSWNGNRTIGETNISIANMVHQNTGELTFVLRTHDGVQFNTQIAIQCHFVPHDSKKSTMKNKTALVGDINGNSSLMVPSNSGGGQSTANSSSALYSSVYSNTSTESASSSFHNFTKLPKGWEIRVDRHGRLLYVDHINKRTTWNPPAVLERENQNKNMNVRRTVFSDVNNNNNNEGTIASQTDRGMDFLQRNDFAHLLYRNQEALKLYNESTYLKHIISRIRKNRANFRDFEHNQELIAFLNLFADTTQRLPDGWEIAKNRFSGQRLFIDHNQKRITAIDPRLPVSRRPRTHSEPPVNRRNNLILDMNSNLSWGISQRTDEITALIRTQIPEIAPRICHKLQNISALGESALERYANDVEVVRAISLLEHHKTTAKTCDFDSKVEYFYNALQRSGYGQGPQRIRLRLRRSNLLADAFDKILSIDPTNLRKCQLIVAFEEEEGLDYGGVSKEMFYLISRDLFNPYHGLFEYSASDTYTVEISPVSKFIDNHLQWMELAGRVLGLSLIHRCLIDTFFTKAFYKMLIGRSYTIEDLKTMDSQFYNSLKWIRENPVTSDLDLTFSTVSEVAGEIIETELLPGGKSLLVGEQNKEEFISLMTRWRIERNVVDQMRALTRGLYSIVPRNYLSTFNEDQLECVLSGKLEINVEDWMRHTEYKGGYSERHTVIEWFWDFVYEMSNAQRLDLLQFVTGTKSVPIEGFKALRGSNGLKMFTIEKWGKIVDLPRAHSCFNRLDLPAYISRQTLKSKLMVAITESCSYAIE